MCSHSITYLCLLCPELDASLEPMFQCNLQPHLPTAEAPIAPSTADSQSMIICAMHRSTDSWVTTFSLLSQPSHSWGHFVPELRTVLSQLPGFPVQKLAAAQEGVVDKVIHSLCWLQHRADAATEQCCCCLLLHTLSNGFRKGIPELIVQLLASCQAQGRVLH